MDDLKKFAQLQEKYAVLVTQYRDSGGRRNVAHEVVLNQMQVLANEIDDLGAKVTRFVSVFEKNVEELKADINAEKAD